jgi:hypothetical protein
VGAAVTTSSPTSPQLSGPSTVAYLIFLLWLELGYAVALAILPGLSWRAAVWQGAVCVAAIIPLLLAVVEVVAIPKRLGRVPAAVMRAIWTLGGLAELMLPWLGWAAVLWLINRGALSWPVAFRSGAGIAMFSYLTGAGLVLWFRPRPEQVQLSSLEIPIPGLPPEFEGYRILHLSDLHIGSSAAVADLGRRLAKAASLRADLTAFTGDLAETPSLADRAAEVLSALAAPDGVVAVLGNHDIWAGEKRVRGALEGRGVRVLVNQHTAISRGGASIYLAGVNDASYTGRDDLDAALAGIPAGAPVILLSHAPVIIRHPAIDRAALVLSGHTHGGQLVLPWIGALYVPSRLGRRYASGLHRIPSGWLFITRGLGEVFPPMRIACPPEIALLTLRSAPSD